MGLGSTRVVVGGGVVNGLQEHIPHKSFCKELTLKACSVYSSVLRHWSDSGMMGFVN